MMRIVFYSLMIFFLLNIFSSCFSQEINKEALNIKKSQKKLQTIKKNITEQTKKEKEIQEQKKRVLEELEEIETKIANVMEEINKLKPEVTKIELEYLNTIQDIEKYSFNFEVLKNNLEGRLRAYQNLTTIGLFNLFFSSRTFMELFTRNIYFKYLLSHDTKIKDEYRTNLHTLSEKKKKLEEQKQVLEARNRELNELHKKLDESRIEKEKFWEKLSEAQEEYKTMIKELRASAEALEKKLRQYRREESPEKVDDIIKDIPTLSIKETDLVYDAQPDHFLSRKGKLITPVYGNVIAKNPIKESKGIIIEATLGSEIRVPVKGRVYYLGNHPGYGNLIILDHGGGYRTLIAQASKFFVELGQIVEEGELIGFSSGGAWIKEGVYIEVQKDNKTLNAREWFDLSGLRVK